MTWWLMWLNGSVATLNATLQLLVIYRLVANPCDAQKNSKKMFKIYIYFFNSSSSRLKAIRLIPNIHVFKHQV